MMKRKWLLLLFPIAVILLIITREYSWIAEYIFARGIYKYYALIWSSFTQWIPFSLMEAGIFLIPIAIIIWIFWMILQLVKRKNERKKFLIRQALSILCFGSVIYFWLTVTCMINYNRYTFAQISELEMRDSSQEELYDLCYELAQRANILRAQLTKMDEDGAMELEDDSVKELSKIAGAAYQKLGEEYEVFAYRTAYTKPIYFSKAMSYTDLVGIYCPFTMETNVNTDVAQYSRPSTITHELAHYYGFMREDEANFISYLACINSESIEFQYSGVMLALIHASNQLYQVNPEKYGELWNHYEEGVLTDFRQNNLYWQKLKENKIRQISETVNDIYLKANHQTDGVKSYGRMVDLLLAWHRKQAE